MGSGNTTTIRKKKKRVLEERYNTHHPKKKNNVRNELHLGTLNVRILRTIEREIELDNVLKEIKFSIIRLSGVRKLREGIIEKTNGNVLCYIGKTKGQKGVGFLLHKNYKHCIQEFKGISERIALLKMATDKIPTTVIQVYAPTESSPEEGIEAFYEDLERTITIHRI
jgi:exonuclease III